jgi:hypothetical protein
MVDVAGKFIGWEINPIQDPNTMHTANNPAAYVHKVQTGKSLKVENFADLEMWKLHYMQLPQFPYWGLTHHCLVFKSSSYLRDF